MDIALSLPIRTYRIATSIFFFVAGLTFSTWASRIPDIQREMHLSEAGLGTILFALPAGLMASLPLSGWIISKFGSKNIVVIAGLLYPFLLIQLGMAANVWQLVAALFLFGLSSNLMNIAMNTQAVGVEKIYGRSIMASFHGLWSVGGFAGALVGTFAVGQGISPLFHFGIVWAITLVLMAFSYKYTLPDSNGEHNSSPIFVKPNRKLLILGLIAFCCLVCEGAMADWSGVYFKKVVEAPASLVTIGYVAFTATMATGRFLGDWMVSRFSVQYMLRISGILIASGLLLAVLLPNLILATLGFLLVGFGVSSVVPIVYGVAGKSTSMAPSVALAAVSTIGFLGFLIGPPLIGFLAEASGLRFAFGAVAVLGLGTALLAKQVTRKSN